jgi:branched-chain amino acid transport system ATP-binding protein
MVLSTRFLREERFSKLTFKAMYSDPALAIQGASLSLGGRGVLNDVSLRVQAGEIVALLGHNGAGKSTLLRCIMGILPLEKGTIRLGFAKWRADSRYLVRSGVCYLPQSDKLFSDLTVEENLRVFAEARQLNDRDFEAQYRQLSEKFPVLGEYRTVLAGRLSGGQAQQAAFARTLLGQARLLLLDEPSIGLHPAGRKTVFELVRLMANQWGAAVIMVEHRVSELLNICQRAYVLRQGAIEISAAASELLAEPELLRGLVM